MSDNGSIFYRAIDRAHRLLDTVRGSEPSVATGASYGDSPNLPDVYFVDSGNGADGNDGRDPGKPMATIDAAINRCTASQGDIVLVQPGHAETVAAAIELDTIGVSVIGVGSGSLKPQVTLSADDNGVELSAASCGLENIHFNERTATPTGNNAYVDVSAADCELKTLLFDCGADDLDSITLASGADRVTIDDCDWNVTADGPDSAIRIESTIDRLTVKHCHQDGGSVANAFDEGGIVSAEIHTRCLIDDNTFLFMASNIGGVQFTAAATGVIKNNHFANGTLGQMLDPGSCMCENNFEQDAVDESAILFPAVNPSGTVGGGAHGGVNDTTTDGMHGKIGTDTEMSDRSLWDLLEGDGFVGAPSAIYPAINTNIQDILLWLADATRKGSGSALGANESLADVLYGANGIVGSWPASGAPTGTGVSIAQALRYISENIRNTTGAFVPGLGLAVVRAGDQVLHDGNTTAAFTVATGRVLITALFAEVATAQVAAGASALRFSANPSTGSTVNLCADLDINAAELGAMFAIAGPTGSALGGGASSAGAVPSMDGSGVIVNVGTIDAISAADATAGGSTLQVTLYYIPLDSGATVVAA